MTTWRGCRRVVRGASRDVCTKRKGARPRLESVGLAKIPRTNQMRPQQKFTSYVHIGTNPNPITNPNPNPKPNPKPDPKPNPNHSSDTKPKHMFETGSFQTVQSALEILRGIFVVLLVLANDKCLIC